MKILLGIHFYISRIYSIFTIAISTQEIETSLYTHNNIELVTEVRTYIVTHA